MASMIRLDRFLSEMGVGSRSDVKKQIGFGNVTVNGKAIRKPETKINPEGDEIVYRKQKVEYRKNVYFMLNKPAGVISASEDRKMETVIDLFEKEHRKNLFCVGRLDKDTEGLLLVTDDGAFAHKLMSPKKHVPKCYEAVVSGIVDEEDVKAMKEGIRLDEEFTSSPAELEILNTDSDKERSVCRLTIYEGRFHQVKRMFEKRGKKVEALKRIRIGNLSLDPGLSVGEYRMLTEEERNSIC